MKIENKFNEVEHRNVSSKYFKFSWKPILKGYFKSLCVSLLPILLGMIMIYGKNNLGYIFICFGIFFMILIYANFKNYLNHKKVYFDKIESYIKEYKANEESIIVEFDDQYFYYSDFKQSFKTQWKYFEKNISIDDYFVFEYKQNITAAFFVKKDKDLENHLKQIGILNL